MNIYEHGNPLMNIYEKLGGLFKKKIKKIELRHKLKQKYYKSVLRHDVSLCKLRSFVFRKTLRNEIIMMSSALEVFWWTLGFELRSGLGKGHSKAARVFLNTKELPYHAKRCSALFLFSQSAAHCAVFGRKS